MKLKYKGIITNIDLDEFSNGKIIVKRTRLAKGFSQTSRYTLNKLDLYFREFRERNKKVYAIILRRKHQNGGFLEFKTTNKKKFEEVYKKLFEWKEELSKSFFSKLLERIR